jgi:hypothetical protein
VKFNDGMERQDAVGAKLREKMVAAQKAWMATNPDWQAAEVYGQQRAEAVEGQKEADRRAAALSEQIEAALASGKDPSDLEKREEQERVHSVLPARRAERLTPLRVESLQKARVAWDAAFRQLLADAQKEATEQMAKVDCIVDPENWTTR